MIPAVIDTNVLVSGLLSPSGNEALILLAVQQGLLRPCLSEPILREYAEVLARPKFAFEPTQVAALLAVLRDKGEVVQPEASPTGSPDPDDAMFLHCAEAAGAAFIVTGNKRHFPDAPYGRVQVVNAGELLEWLTLDMECAPSGGHGSGL